MKFSKYNKTRMQWIEGMNGVGRVKEKVDHPDHYNVGKIEVIDAIEDWGLDFCLGNVVKYISRAGHKDSNKVVEDLKKAAWYLQRKIDFLEK